MIRFLQDYCLEASNLSVSLDFGGRRESSRSSHLLDFTSFLPRRFTPIQKEHPPGKVSVATRLDPIPLKLLIEVVRDIVRA